MSNNCTISIRTFRSDDLPALVDLINAAATADHEESSTTLEALTDRFYRPYFFVEDNCFVALADDGRIVGYVTAELDPRFGRGWGSGCVHPDFRRKGIGAQLLRTADQRHRDRGETEMKPDLALSVTRFARDTNAPTMALYAAHDYTIVRCSWIMHIDFDAALSGAVPALPEGYTLHPVDSDPDAPYGGRAILAAEADIFRHNWGYVAPPFEVWEQIYMRQGYDPALWLVAVDATGQIAGLCCSRPKGPNNPELGWVETLGVREAHRKRGLGRTLLQQGFARLQQQGYRTAELEVDSENATNSVALYEQAGMHVDRRYLIYGKELRAASG